MTARYSQCHGDCTVDCGHCKGNGRPAEACIYCGRPHLGVELPDCPPVPAEAQQDDEVERAAQAIWESQLGTVPWSELSLRTPTRDEYRRFARAALAARPSADTETLRDVLLKHHPIAHTDTGPLKGCRCGQVKLGQDVIAHVTAEIRAALDGGQ